MLTLHTENLNIFSAAEAIIVVSCVCAMVTVDSIGDFNDDGYILILFVKQASLR